MTQDKSPVERLLEYKMYKYMALELKDRQIDAQKVLYKQPDVPEEISDYETPVNMQELLSDLTLNKLHTIFESIIKKQENKVDSIRSKFGKIEKEEVSLTDKIEYVQEYALKSKRFSFRNLLTKSTTKMQLVVKLFSGAARK